MSIVIFLNTFKQILKLELKYSLSLSPLFNPHDFKDSNEINCFILDIDSSFCWLCSQQRLSGLLEAPGEKDRIKIINAAEYVKQRIKNLLEGLAENEITGGSGNKDNKEYKVDSIEKYEGWIYKVGK